MELWGCTAVELRAMLVQGPGLQKSQLWSFGGCGVVRMEGDGEVELWGCGAVGLWGCGAVGLWVSADAAGLRRSI